MPGNRLESIRWNRMDSTPVNKDFWSFNEHLEVRACLQQQCERLRSENSIFIVDDDAFDVPKPIRIVTKLRFPSGLSQR